jgi:hypothetical protein
MTASYTDQSVASKDSTPLIEQLHAALELARALADEARLHLCAAHIDRAIESIHKNVIAQSQDTLKSKLETAP